MPATVHRHAHVLRTRNSAVAPQPGNGSLPHVGSVLDLLAEVERRRSRRAAPPTSDRGRAPRSSLFCKHRGFSDCLSAVACLPDHRADLGRLDLVEHDVEANFNVGSGTCSPVAGAHDAFLLRVNNFAVHNAFS